MSRMVGNELFVVPLARRRRDVLLGQLLRAPGGRLLMSEPGISPA